MLSITKNNLSIQTEVRKSEIFYTQVPEMKHCAEMSTFEYQTYIGELQVSWTRSHHIQGYLPTESLEGVGLNSSVVSSGVPITKNYNARLGSSTLHSSQIHGEPSLVEFSYESDLNQWADRQERVWSSNRTHQGRSSLVPRKGLVSQVQILGLGPWVGHELLGRKRSDR